MAYREFKNLLRRTASDKVLRDKAFSIAKNPKCDEYQRELVLIVCKFSVKKSSDAAIMQNQQLAEELHKPIIRKF